MNLERRKKATRSSLNDDEVLNIFNANGSSQEIAKRFNVNPIKVRRIKSGRTYGYVTGKVWEKPNRKKREDLSHLTPEEKKQRHNEYVRKYMSAKYTPKVSKEERRLKKQIILKAQKERKAKEVQMYPNRQINLSELKRINLDAKTVIFVKPDVNEDEIRARFLTRKW